MTIRDAICPECGGELSVSVDEDEKTRQLIVSLFCEGDGEDRFELEIATGLTNKQLAKLKPDRTKTLPMEGRLTEREKDPYPD